MNTTIKKITIRKGEYKPKLSEKAKELKEKKKKARKIFEKANQQEKQKTLDEYIEAQKLLRAELTAIEKTRIRQRVDKIIREGGIKSDLFWKTRKRIKKNANKDEEYDPITEEGDTITDPEKAKKHYETFYQDLYQARPGKE